MDWYIYPLVVAAGFACGFINTLAGSGSLITLPLLIFLGLPANVANGTNRVAILLQNVAGVTRFHRSGVLNWKRGLILAIPASIGAIVGAQIAVNLDEELLRRTIGGLMVIMFFILLIRPKRWLQGRPELTDKPVGITQIVVFFLIGVYGGFIQAGVGLFLLAGLVLGAGFDLVKGNAVKVLIILVFTVFALLVFVRNDQVNWSIGLILAIGNMLGAWVAAKMAVTRGAGFVRWLLIAVVVVSAILLLDIPSLIERLFA
ncbi:TSUP family transporter [candidate division GN15 bacterium]|nr:TSUP family transporter [candidate division GN15 bacterium]